MHRFRAILPQPDSEVMMSFEDLKVRIAMMLDGMVHQPEDLHELQEQLREELANLRSLGLPLPEDLVALENRLEADLRVPD